MKGIGARYVKELRRLTPVDDTKLHQDFQTCSVCKYGPIVTIEEMIDHMTAHAERLNCRIGPKDGRWIVFVEPHEQYTRKDKRRPAKPLPTLRHLSSIRRQMKEADVDPDWTAELTQHDDQT